MEDEICPYATFHLLGFREEMDPTKAMNFQTFPHQNGTATPGHTGTMGTGPSNAHMHSRSGSQSMVSSDLIQKPSNAESERISFDTFFSYSFHQNRYARKNSQGGQSSIYSPAPEYDDPANCAEEDQYVSIHWLSLKLSLTATSSVNYNIK